MDKEEEREKRHCGVAKLSPTSSSIQVGTGIRTLGTLSLTILSTSISRTLLLLFRSIQFGGKGHLAVCLARELS
jgi:hypothetical protein